MATYFLIFTLFFCYFFDLACQIDVFFGHFAPSIVGAKANGDGAVHVGQLRMVIDPLAGESHFSNKADGFGEAAKPVGFADRVIGKCPTGEAGQCLLDLVFGEWYAHTFK